VGASVVEKPRGRCPFWGECLLWAGREEKRRRGPLDLYFVCKGVGIVGILDSDDRRGGHRAVFLGSLENLPLGFHEVSRRRNEQKTETVFTEQVVKPNLAFASLLSCSSCNNKGRIEVVKARLWELAMVDMELSVLLCWGHQQHGNERAPARRSVTRSEDHV
jgi:hypothetical protein